MATYIPWNMRMKNVDGTRLGPFPFFFFFFFFLAFSSFLSTSLSLSLYHHFVIYHITLSYHTPPHICKRRIRATSGGHDSWGQQIKHEHYSYTWALVNRRRSTQALGPTSIMDSKKKAVIAGQGFHKMVHGAKKIGSPLTFHRTRVISSHPLD